jgi:hypothetical protein
MQVLNIEKTSAVYGGNAPTVVGVVTEGEQKVLDSIQFSIKTTSGLEQQAWMDAWPLAFWTFRNS